LDLSEGIDTSLDSLEFADSGGGQFAGSQYTQDSKEVAVDALCQL